MTELLLSDSRALIQDVVAWTICICALIWGGGPERAVAAVWIVFFELFANLYTLATGTNLKVEDIDAFFASIDVLAAVCWVAIALYANRNYTLWIAAMQILAMTAHVARGLVEAIAPVGYVIMVAVPGWFQLILLAVGVTRHILRKRKHGEYRDWRIQKPNIDLGSGNGLASLQGEPAWHQAQQPSWRDDVK